MATKKLHVPTEIYQIKVTLKGVSPPVWRRVLVSADMTLGDLHEVLQIAMGWGNYHMHDFSIGKQQFSSHDLAYADLGLPAGAWSCLSCLQGRQAKWPSGRLRWPVRVLRSAQRLPRSGSP